MKHADLGCQQHQFPYRQAGQTLLVAGVIKSTLDLKTNRNNFSAARQTTRLQS